MLSVALSRLTYEFIFANSDVMLLEEKLRGAGERDKPRAGRVV
jgi:hypothetical protein